MPAHCCALSEVILLQERSDTDKMITGKKKVTTLSLVCILLASPLFIIHSSLLHAAAPEKELADIHKKIEEDKEKIQETRKKEQSLLIALKTINLSIKKNTAEISRYNLLISEKAAKIDSINTNISSMEKGLAERRELLEERLKGLYKFRRNEIALIFMSANDFQDLSRKSRYISYIAEYDRRLIEDFHNDLKKLDIKKQKLETLKSGLESNRKILSQKTEELKAQKRRKSSLLASAKKRRSHYEKEIKELTRSSKRLRAMIKRISRLGRSKPFSDKGFSSMKGRLPWPVKGSVVIPFGKYTDPNVNIQVYKNGVEISANHGASIKSILDGKVVFADKFKGYGLLVILDHGGGYHTLYGQLSEIFHETGAIIKKGSVIGKTGMSRSMDLSTLYFEIRHKGKPIDPLKWLTK